MSFSPAWALFVILGIGLALWMTAIQWRARGGHKGDLWAITVVTVPAAVVGGRLGHVLLSLDTYFGPGISPLRALAVWDGGFSFWGALLVGLVTAVLLTRYQGIRILPFLDAVAPGLILGQVAGAWGDWFDGRVNLPSIIVESAWNLFGCIALIIISKRLRLGYGQVFALYLCLFGLGRVMLEALRIGTPAAAHAREVLGLSLNVWTAALTLFVGFVWLIVSRLRHRTQERGVYVHQARTLIRRRDRGKHTYEVNAPMTGSIPYVVETGTGTNVRRPADRSTQDPAADAGAGHPSIARQEAARAAGAAQPPAPDDEEAIALRGAHSFGFFGAVTSAISIVPDVRGRTGVQPGARMEAPSSGQEPSSPER
ncbi:prolipoprotein diacylglyceryl transferase [Brevibacterium renqingii]|uniref:prolipoprotein diacylglyceryl transferase n=1 Tax=Brevibacterium renqingii TaxID=2776916 RepID=UPI001ADECA79|nr:prolipoprotein diacylglyceryl transferase family protein [Brevibacterium renqingii]